MITPSFAFAAEKPVQIQASTAIGYDQNPHLDASRDDDMFAQGSADVYYRRKLSEISALRLSSGIQNVSYFEATDENVMPLYADAGWDLKLGSSTALETDYEFQYVYFPNQDIATYFSHKARTGLRQRISRSLELRGGFGVTWIELEDRKRRGPAGLLDADERADSRYTADGEINFRLNPKALWRFGYAYNMNDSNDQFHDYYNWNGYRLYAGLSSALCQNMNGIFRFSYENREYDSRPLVDNASIFEENDIYTATAGLFYKFRTDIALGFIYSYRQKNSNEPSQQYSGSVSTLGLYYSF